MKVPGIGEVKPTYLYIGVGVSIVGVMYWRKKNAAASAAAAASVAASSSGTSTDSGIDPSTGLPYADETSSAYGGGSAYSGYGGIDPSTGVPYIYESGGTGTTNNTSGITTDSQWAQQAEGDLVSTFGYSLTVAQSAVTKYMSQSLSGLNDQEYEAISAIIAELGPPPSGTFRLIHAPTSSPPSTGGSSLPQVHPGEVIKGPWLLAPGSLNSVAARFGISPQHVIAENPGLTGKEKAPVSIFIPYQVQNGDSIQSIAAKYEISPEHLAQYVPSS